MVLTLVGPRFRRVRSVLLGIGAVDLAAALLLPVDVWILQPLEDRFAKAGAPGHVDGVVDAAS